MRSLEVHFCLIFPVLTRDVILVSQKKRKKEKVLGFLKSTVHLAPLCSTQGL